LELFFRIVLGSILGSLLGVVWTNGEPIHLEGVNLSLAALAFFVGFMLETVSASWIARLRRLGRWPDRTAASVTNPQWLSRGVPLVCAMRW
jgi:hypothetical protein